MTFDEARAAQSRARKEMDRAMLTMPPHQLGALEDFRRRYDAAQKAVQVMKNERQAQMTREAL